MEEQVYCDVRQVLYGYVDLYYVVFGPPLQQQQPHSEWSRSVEPVQYACLVARTVFGLC